MEIRIKEVCFGRVNYEACDLVPFVSESDA